MLKVNKASAMPTEYRQMNFGDVFIYEGKVCMKVTHNGQFLCVNLENAKTMTGIHSDTRVTRCEATLNVSSYAVGGI